MMSTEARPADRISEELKSVVARKLAEIEGRDWTAGMTAPVAEDRTTYGVDAPL